MSLLWISINCRHEGFDDLADELLDCTIDEGAWWLFDDLFHSIAGRPTIGRTLCIVMAIILMMC